MICDANSAYQLHRYIRHQKVATETHGTICTKHVPDMAALFGRVLQVFTLLHHKLGKLFICYYKLIIWHHSETSKLIEGQMESNDSPQPGL